MRSGAAHRNGMENRFAGAENHHAVKTVQHSGNVLIEAFC